MSNKELFLSPNNLKENFQTVADEIFKNTGYNISRHRSLELKFNSMAEIVLNKTNEEERTLIVLNTKIQDSSVTYFQKIISKNKSSKQNIELNNSNSNSNNLTEDINQQMNQLLDDRQDLIKTPGATDNYMPRPSNPSNEYLDLNQRTSELEKMYESQASGIQNVQNPSETDYSVQPFTISNDVFNNLSFDDEKDLPLYQNISTLQEQDNTNPMELMNQAEQSRNQNNNNYNLIQSNQQEIAKSIINQGERDIVLERNNTDATTKIDQTLVEPKILHQQNEEWQNRMLNHIATNIVSNNIVSNLDKTIDTLLQNKLVNLQRDAQPEYQDKIHYISVNSIDRNGKVIQTMILDIISK